MNKIRIIGGIWRSRQINVPDQARLRPTPNRIRETLFNWLQYDIVGANCLDLFAGSGALGFEALSRGAKSATIIEQDTLIFKNLLANGEHLQAQNASFQKTNALTWLEATQDVSFDIVFLDPPYSENLIQPCLNLLVNRNFLSIDAKIYLEHNQPLSEIVFPEGLRLLHHKKAGQVYYGLLSFTK
jgi:16S rRNA (guanine966-N2)-methyltransferase